MKYLALGNDIHAALGLDEMAYKVIMTIERDRPVEVIVHRHVDADKEKSAAELIKSYVLVEQGVA
jgi:hypothetical protein